MSGYVFLIGTALAGTFLIKKLCLFATSDTLCVAVLPCGRVVRKNRGLCSCVVMWLWGPDGVWLYGRECPAVVRLCGREDLEVIW